MNLVALIVTFNRLEKLKKCWKATEAEGFSHIVIVDNASTDGTSEWLSTLTDKRLCVLKLNHNIGGAGGFRYGSAWICKNLSCDWVVFYDDDAYPSEGLVKYFLNRNPNDADIWCAQVKDEHGQLCRMNLPWRSMPASLMDSVCYVLLPQRFLPQDELACDVCTFSFVGTLISFPVLKKEYSHILPELFIYYDDVYFSWKLYNKGYCIRYDTNLHFIHEVSSFYGKDSAWKIYYKTRNLLLSRYFFKEGRPFTVGAIIMRVTKYFLDILVCKNRKECLGFFIKGVSDGIQHKTGKLDNS